MAQQAQIVAELKRSLKEAGVTYSSVAKRLNLSVASVKRLFSAGDFTLQRTLRSAARECIDIIERDDSLPEARRGTAFLLAARPWQYSGFVEFLRT